MKHNPTATANALAATGGVLYIICRVAILLFPNPGYSIAQTWLHGIALTPSGTWSLSLEGFVVGLVSFTAFAWFSGYLFATLYNNFLPSKSK